MFTYNWLVGWLRVATGSKSRSSKQVYSQLKKMSHDEAAWLDPADSGGFILEFSGLG